MKRSAPLRRSGPLKRSGPIKRSGPVKRRSAKTQASVAARTLFVKEQLADRPYCEAGRLIEDDKHRCDIHSSEMHEPLRRSQGGSIVDVNNSVAICRPCHRWVHDHPALSYDLGLLVRRGTGGTTDV